MSAYLLNVAAGGSDTPGIRSVGLGPSQARYL